MLKWRGCTGARHCETFLHLTDSQVYMGAFLVHRSPAYMLDFRLAVNAVSRGAYLGSLPVGGTDLFELTVANPTRYTFTTGDGQGGCPGDTVMTMYRIEANGSLTQVATDDESGSGPCSQIMRFLLERNVMPLTGQRPQCG